VHEEGFSIIFMARNKQGSQRAALNKAGSLGLEAQFLFQIMDVGAAILEV